MGAADRALAQKSGPDGPSRSRVVIERCRRLARDRVGLVRLSRISADQSQNTREGSREEDKDSANQLGCDETEQRRRRSCLHRPRRILRREGHGADHWRIRHACDHAVRGHVSRRRDRWWRRRDCGGHRTLVSDRNLRRPRLRSAALIAQRDRQPVVAHGCPLATSTRPALKEPKSGDDGVIDRCSLSCRAASARRRG